MKIFEIVAALLIMLALLYISSDIEQLRWDYEFVHGLKTCNFADKCPR